MHQGDHDGNRARECEGVEDCNCWYLHEKILVDCGYVWRRTDRIPFKVHVDLLLIVLHSLLHQN